MRDGTTFLVECKTRMRDNPIYDSYQIQAGGGKTMGRGDGWFCVLWNSCVTSETKFKDARDMLAAIERIAFVETAEFGKLKHKGKETCRLCVKKFTLAEGRIEKNRIKQLHVVTGAEGVVPKNKKMFAEKIDYTDPNILTEAGARICAWAATEAAARVIHEAAEAARTTKGV